MEKKPFNDDLARYQERHPFLSQKGYSLEEDETPTPPTVTIIDVEEKECIPGYCIVGGNICDETLLTLLSRSKK